MLTAVTTQFLSYAGDDLKLAVFLMDLLAKSLILVVLIYYLERIFDRFLTSSHRHLLWIGAILLIGLLPIASSIFGPLLKNFLANSNLALVTVLVPNDWTAPPIHLLQRAYGWADILLIVYLSFLSYLFLKLVLSFFRVYRIQRTAQYNTADDATALLDALRSRLGISRKVSLGSSIRISAPISFGLIRPKIILPDGSDSWDDSFLENVLIHELSHIKRLDWLTHITVYLVASINWFNPFVWRSLSRLRLEAEYSCDNAVLRNGGSKRSLPSKS